MTNKQHSDWKRAENSIQQILEDVARFSLPQQEYFNLINALQAKDWYKKLPQYVKSNLTGYAAGMLYMITKNLETCYRIDGLMPQTTKELYAAGYTDEYIADNYQAIGAYWKGSRKAWHETLRESLTA